MKNEEIEDEWVLEIQPEKETNPTMWEEASLILSILVIIFIQV